MTLILYLWRSIGQYFDGLFHSRDVDADAGAEHGEICGCCGRLSGATPLIITVLVGDQHCGVGGATADASRGRHPETMQQVLLLLLELKCAQFNLLIYFFFIRKVTLSREMQEVLLLNK